MANINVVILAGNLTRDPELRVTSRGTSVCTFGVAVNRTWNDQNGNCQQDTTFVDVTAFGKTGETISKYFAKGKPIFIEGRLQFDSWEDNNTGQKRNRLSVIANAFQFVGSARDEDSAPQQRDTRPHMQDPKPAFDPNDNLDEDVPF